MAIVTSEMIWIKTLLAALGVFLDKPMQQFCDNQAALHMAKNPVFHEQIKRIEIDCHFVRERILSGDLVACYLSSKHQLADIFTKALDRQIFQYLQGKLGMIDPHAPP